MRHASPRKKKVLTAHTSRLLHLQGITYTPPLVWERFASRGEWRQMGRSLKWDMTLSLCSRGYAIKLSAKYKAQ